MTLTWQTKLKTEVKQMNQVIDLALVGKEAGIPTKEIPGPFGETMYEQTWTKEYLPTVFSMLQQRIQPGDVPMTAHTYPWVFLAITYALDIEDRFVFAVPGGNHRLIPLMRGTPDPAIGVVFKTLEDGDNLFVYFDTDPDKPENKVFPKSGDEVINMENFVPQEHSFDASDIPKIVVPDIPRGKNVYFYGDGIFPAHLVVAHELGKGQKSLWVGCHGEDYTCVFSDTSEVGDTYPLRKF